MKPSSKLSELKKGERAEIIGFSDQDLPVKFLEIGLIPGSQIEYKCSAPFNGPICVSLCTNKCVLALRKDEANSVLVNKLK